MEREPSFNVEPEAKKAEQASADFKFEILNDQEQRELLMGKIEQLIDKMRTDRVENVTFLDKSARPLSVLCRTLWYEKYPDEEFPKTSFINIGREIVEKLCEKDNRKSWEDLHWGEEREKERKEHEKWINGLSPEDIFDVVGEKERERVQKEYRYLAEVPKDTKVLLVEEFATSGESMVVARKILENLFPNAQFEPFTLVRHGPENKLFFNEALFDYFSPPWRKNKDQLEYGVIGVVDDEEKPLTVKPTREHSLEERLAAVDTDIAKSYEIFRDGDSWYGSSEKALEAGEDKIKKIQDFDIEEKKYKGSKKDIGTATSIVKRYLEETMIPLAEKVAPFLRRLKETINTKTNFNQEIMEAIEQIILANHEMAEIGGDIFYQHFEDHDGQPTLRYRLMEENNVPEEDKEKVGRIMSNIFDDITEKIFGRSFGSNFFLYHSRIEDINKLNERKKLIQSTDYAALVVKFRNELRQTVEEYWKKKKQGT